MTCHFCSSAATHRVVWAGGHGAIPVDERHISTARHVIERLNHDAVHDVQELHGQQEANGFALDGEWLDPGHAGPLAVFCAAPLHRGPCKKIEGGPGHTLKALYQEVHGPKLAKIAGVDDVKKPHVPKPDLDEHAPKIDGGLADHGIGAPVKATYAEHGAPKAAIFHGVGVNARKIAKPVKLGMNAAGTHVMIHDKETGAHIGHIHAETPMWLAGTGIKTKPETVKLASGPGARKATTARKTTATARRASGGQGGQNGRGGRMGGHNVNWPNGVPGNGFGGGLLAGHMLGGKKGPKGATGAKGRKGTTAVQTAATQLAALKAAGPQGLRTVPTAPNQLDVSMKNAAAAQNRLLLQHAQLQAQTLAEQLGKNKGHPAVQYYGQQLGKAYQAQAAYNRAVQAAQRQTTSAEARNKAVMDAYAKRLAALQARAAGQKAKAALQSATTTGPTSSGTPVKVPANALPKVFQLDDAAEPLMHFELMRSPVEEYAIQQADAYALVASATYDQLDAMLAADHDFCDVGVFCRNPLHPGPCKGWKWALYGIAPEVYHHIERRRVAKINEKRAAKVAHLQSQGLKVPAHLLKEATYDPAKLKPHPESYAPPLPGDKGIAHIPSSHVIQANIGLKNAAKKIEQQKAMAHHVDQATKTISAASEAMGKPLGSGIGDQLHAQLTKAAQDLKPGESLSQHPKVAPTLKAMAGYASKHAGYGPAATEEIHKDLVHHIDTNQGSTPALVKSAMEVGDAKAKAAAEEKAQHEAAAAHPQLPLGHHGGPLNGAQTDPEIAKTIEANAGKGAGLVGVFPPSKIKTMKVPGNATTKIQFGHIDDKGTVYDKAGKVIGQHIESTGNGSEEHGWVHVQTTVPGTTEGTRKTVAVWKGVATGPKSGAAKKAAAAALKATEGKEAPGGEAKSAHSALLDKMEAHDWASATPAQVLNSRVALKKIIDHPDSTPEEKARAQALSQKITKGLGAKVEQQAKHEDLPGTKAAKMMDKIYSGPHAKLTEADINPPESELEPHEVDQLAKKAAKATAPKVAEPEGTHINPHTAQTLAAKKETFYPKEKIADPENLQAGHVVPIPNGGSTGHGWGQIMGPPTKKYGEMYVNVAEPGKGPHAVPVTQVKKDLAGYATATKEAGKAEPKGFTVTATAPTETVVKKLGGAAAETHQANTYTQLTALKKQAAEPEKLTAEGKAAALDQLHGIAEHQHSTDVQKKMATALANKINAHTAKQEADKAEAAHQAQLEADKHTALKANQAGAMHHMLASLGMANDSSEHNAMAHGIIGKAHEQLESKAVPGEKVTDHPVVKQAISKITNKVQQVLQDKAAKDGTGKSPGVDKVYPQVADALEHGHGELPPYVQEAVDHLNKPEASAATKKLYDAVQGGASPAVLANAASHPHVTTEDLGRLGHDASHETYKAINTAHGNTVEGTKEQKELAKAHEKLFGALPDTKAKPAGPTPEEHAQMDAQAHAIGNIGKALGLVAPTEQVIGNAKKMMLEHHAKGLTPTDHPVIQKSIKMLGDQAIGKFAKAKGLTDVSQQSQNNVHSQIKAHVLKGKAGLPQFVKTVQEAEREKAAGKPAPGSISLANAMGMPGVTPAMIVKHADSLSKEQHDLLPEAKQQLVKDQLDKAYLAGNKLAGGQLMKFGYPTPAETKALADDHVAKATGPLAHPDMMAVADLSKMAKQGTKPSLGEVVNALSKDGVTKAELEKLPLSTREDIAAMVDKADQNATGIDHAGLQAMWHQLGLSKYHDAQPSKVAVEQEAKDLTLGKPGMSYTDKMQHVDKAEWDKLSPGAKAWHQDVWKDLQADGGPSTKAKVQQIQDKLLGAESKINPDHPGHVKAAFDYGTKNKAGTGTMKLKAYEQLSHGEYHSLPLAVQKQIKTDMEAGRAKFLDPKKIQSVDNKLAVWGEPEEVKGAPKGWGAIEATTSPMAEADGKIPKGTEHNVSGGTSKFSILPKDQRGQSGDGYYQGGGQWGKYGASGVMIRTMGDDGEWRYLMVQRGGVDADSSKTGKWQLAGGALEEKENAYQAAAREVQEELKADPHYLAGMQSHGEHIYTAPNGWKYTSIAATAPTKFNPVVDGHETADARWFTKEQLDQLDKDGHLIPELSKGALDKNIISLYGMPTAKSTVTPKSNLGAGTDISKLDPHTKQQIKNAYKSQTTGSSLNHSPESIYVNLLAIAHAYGTPKKKLSVMQVIRTIDEQHYSQLDPGPENAHRLEDKITEWLKTPEGASFAKNAKPSPHVLSELKTEGNATLSIKPGETPVGSPAGGPGPFKKALTGDKFESVGHYQASKMMADGQANWTPEQIDALQAYTSSAHDMNSYLRTPGDPATAHTKKQAAAVQAAMRPIPKHVLLVRGTARSDALPAGFNTQASAHGLVGKTISDPGFLSTSVDHPFSGDLQLEIEAPAGTMGAYVEDITNVSGEYEMLLAAGTKLKVLSVTDDGMYGTRMRVRVVSTKSGKH